MRAFCSVLFKQVAFDRIGVLWSPLQIETGLKLGLWVCWSCSFLLTQLETNYIVTIGRFRAAKNKNEHGAFLCRGVGRYVFNSASDR